jgi:hypothetical protein
MIKDAKSLAKICGDTEKFKRYNVKSSALDCPLSLYLEMAKYVGDKQRMMK